MPNVQRRDSVLWFSHLPRGVLRTQLEALAPGERITLSLEGREGPWERMQSGRDGRPTNGVKPLPPVKALWNGLARGTWVTVELIGQPGAEPEAAEDASILERLATAVPKRIAPAGKGGDPCAMEQAVVRAEAAPDRMDRPIVVIGCDVGVDEHDRHTGLIVLRHAPGQPLELLRDPENATHAQALETLPRLVDDHAANVVVLDAPLLPAVVEAPPEGHPGSFRPNESLIRQGRRRVIEAALDAEGADAQARIQTMYDFLGRMVPFSTWRLEGGLAPFAECGRELCDALSDRLPLVTAFTRPQDGVLEGFPKAFYLPRIDFDDAPVAHWASRDLTPRGEVDERVLEHLLDPDHPHRFWEPAGLQPPGDAEGDLQGARWEAAFEDPDLITALAMALNGVLYARGRASAFRAFRPAAELAPFDFGHILSVELDLFQPWARHWLADRVQRCQDDYPNVTLEIADGV